MLLLFFGRFLVIQNGSRLAGMTPPYFDPLGLLHGRRARDPYLQHTAVETGAYAALVNTLRQRHAPAERTEASLAHIVTGTFTLLLGLALPGDGKYPVVQRDVHVVQLHARQLGPDDYVPVFLQHVQSRRPPGWHIPLLSSAPASDVSEYLVEHPVHLALHVIKTAEGTQSHLVYLLARSGSPAEAFPSDCTAIIPLANSL